MNNLKRIKQVIAMLASRQGFHDQNALAEKSGRPQGTISRFLNKPSGKIEVLADILTALNIDLVQLLEHGDAVEIDPARELYICAREAARDTEQISHDQRLEIIHDCIAALPWSALNAELARMKLLSDDMPDEHGFKPGRAIRKIAEQELYWYSIHPQGADIEFMERRVAHLSGGFRNERDWIEKYRLVESERMLPSQRRRDEKLNSLADELRVAEDEGRYKS